MARICRLCSLPIMEAGNWDYHPDCRLISLKESGARQFEIDKAKERLSYYNGTKRSRKKLMRRVKHWNKSMSYKKLEQLFPDIAEKYKMELKRRGSDQGNETAGS